MRMTFQEALDSLYEKYGKYGCEREFLADLLNEKPNPPAMLG